MEEEVTLFALACYIAKLFMFCISIIVFVTLECLISHNVDDNDLSVLYDL